MTKREALDQFKELYLPLIPKDDIVMKCEEWNNYTDGLCKDGLITMRQYETWDNPF